MKILLPALLSSLITFSHMGVAHEIMNYGELSMNEQRSADTALTNSHIAIQLSKNFFVGATRARGDYIAEVAEDTYIKTDLKASSTYLGAVFPVSHTLDFFATLTLKSEQKEWRAGYHSTLESDRALRVGMKKSFNHNLVTIVDYSEYSAFGDNAINLMANYYINSDIFIGSKVTVLDDRKIVGVSLGITF